MGFKRVRLRAQAAYSLGGVLMDLPRIMISMYLASYLAGTLRLPVFAAAAGVLGVRIFGVSGGLLIGVLSDRARSNGGSLRRWMAAGAVLFTLLFALLFQAGPGWEPGVRTIYICVLCGLAAVCAELWEIPCGALSSCITSDPAAQAGLMGGRILVSAVAVSGVFLPLGPHLSGWLPAVCLLPFALLCCAGTREAVPAGARAGIWEWTESTVRSIPLLRLLPGFFALGFMGLGRMVVARYYFTYVLQDTRSYAFFSQGHGLLGGLGALLGVALLHRLFRCRESACVFCCAVLVAASVLLCTVNPISLGTPVVLIILWTGSLASGMAAGLLYGMLPGTVEYAQRRTGARSDGLIYAAASFVSQLGGAVGPLGLGVLLKAAGYTQGSALQSAAVLAVIRGSMNLLPALLAAATIVALLSGIPVQG